MWGGDHYNVKFKMKNQFWGASVPQSVKHVLFSASEELMLYNVSPVAQHFIHVLHHIVFCCFHLRIWPGACSVSPIDSSRFFFTWKDG